MRDAPLQSQLLCAATICVNAAGGDQQGRSGAGACGMGVSVGSGQSSNSMITCYLELRFAMMLFFLAAGGGEGQALRTGACRVERVFIDNGTQWSA